VKITEFGLPAGITNPVILARLMTTPEFELVSAVFCETKDTDVLCELQELMIEPVDSGATFASGAWTIPEVIGYMTKRQDDFIKRTSIIQRREPLNYIPETHRVDLPVDLVVLRRLVFKDADPRTRFCVPVCRGDTWEVDQARLDWEYNHSPDFPFIYSDSEAHQLGIEVAPATSRKGVLESLYVPRGVPFTNDGVCFSVPGEFVPGIRWGVLADMLIKVGRLQDPVRAKYAEGRYEEAVEAANLMLAGWA